MEREERYIIIKIKDLEEYLPNCTRILLGEICNLINFKRHEDGKDKVKAVVIESDWPEYETVWKLLEERVDHQNTIP